MAGTTVKIGFWQTSNDQMVAHPNCPTGAIFDINDGSTFSILDPSKTSGTGFDWGQIKREVLTTGNPRTTGSRVTTSTYRENREVKVHLFLGPTASFSALQAAIHNLVMTCKGISNEYPGVLEFQTTGMANPLYFDVLEAHTDARFQELMWLQDVDDSFVVTFTCKPFARGARQWLQNLCNNPGAEAPSGPAVTVFNDPLTNFNAYQTSYISTVLADSPVSFWKTNETSGTTMTDSVATNNGTIVSGVTVGQTSFNGEADLGSYLYATGKVQVPYTAALNTSVWTLEAWVNPTGGAGTLREILDCQNGNVGINLYATAANTYGLQFGTGSGVITMTGGTVTLNAWTHIMATFTAGGTVTLYVNGSSVSTNAGQTFSANTSSAWFVGTNGASNYWIGSIGPIAYYATALASGRVSAHYSAGGSGGTLAQDKFTYLDTVLADAPLRYYRLDEASGTTARDAMFSGTNGTYTGTVTLGVTGALTSDPQSDTAVTLDGSTAYVTAGGSGLPTGNAAHALDCWIKFAANPAATEFILSLGDGNTAGHFSALQLTSAGKLQWSNSTTTVTAAAALSTGTWHHVGCSYDGTTLTLEADGASVGTATPTNTLSMPTNSVMIGARFTTVATSFFAGSIDEAAVYGANIGLTRLTAHYNAGHNAPSATSNTITIPAGMQLAFGSPAWTSYNNWQVRFRWQTGLTAQFYLHYKDSNNYLLCQMQSTTFSLINVVGGASTTLSSTNSVVLTNGMWYWVQVAQFPFLPQLAAGNGVGSITVAMVSASLSVDSAGAIGTAINTLSPVATTDLGSSYTSTGATSSLVGRAQLAASGTTMAVGGNFSNVNEVQLFGPGGWSYSNFGTGQASGAWESYQGACYTLGPVTSYGAGRMDAPPAGVFNCQWTSGFSGSTNNMILYGIPATQGQVFGVTAYVDAPTISAGCVTTLTMIEYNSSGTMTTSGTVTSHTGPLSGYTKMSGTYTVANAGTNYCLIAINENDTTAGASANATVWWDDIIVWNQTTTGMTTMPYCELRFPQAPAEFTISGLLGDMPAPALYSVGVNVGTSAWPTGRTANVFMGRRAKFNKAAQLLTPAYPGTSVTNMQPTVASSAFGGYYLQTTSNTTTTLATFPSQPFDSTGQNVIDGTYLALSRMQITGAATPTAVSVTANILYSGASGNPSYAYPTQTPFTANSTWTLCQLGQITANISPPATTAAQGNWVQPFVGCDSSSKVAYCNYMALVPLDAEYFNLYANNVSVSYSGGWIHTYLDGVNRSCSFSVDTAVAALPSTGISNVSANSSVTTFGYSQPIADPTLGGGVNQLCLVAQDSAGNVLPCSLEIIYSPLYAFTS